MKPPKFVENWVLTHVEEIKNQQEEAMIEEEERVESISPTQRIIAQRAIPNIPKPEESTGMSSGLVGKIGFSGVGEKTYKLQPIGVKGDRVVAFHIPPPKTEGVETPIIKGTLVGEIDEFVLVKDETGNPITLLRREYDFYVKV